jgi:nucleotide-binding universal stress UspA family protein
MSKPIVVGVDPVHGDEGPLELTRLLAHLVDAQVVAVAAYPYNSPVRMNDYGREHAEQALAATRSRLPEHARRRAVPGASTGLVLHEQAQELNPALLVIGSAHHGALGRTFMGSTADAMLHGTSCAVAIAPRGYEAPNTIETVGVAFVDTAEGRDALTAAGALARRSGATLHVATVVQPINWSASVPPPADALGPELERARAAAEDSARSAAAELAPGVPIAIHALVDNPVAALARMSAEWDVLVCGSRGYGPLRAVLLGSVSRGLAHAVACPLLVLPRDSEPRVEALFAARSATTPA